MIQKTAEGGIPDMILAIDKHHIQLGKGILERIFYDESAVNIELDNGAGQITAADTGTDIGNHGPQGVQNRQPFHIGKGFG